MKKIFLLLSVFILNSYSYSQEKQYFQQEVNYKINVSLDDTKNDLHADASIEYINNSPDELSFIWFHIWPNAYKNNKTPLAKQLIADGNLKFYYASDDERGETSLREFSLDNTLLTTSAEISADLILK